MRNRIFIGAIVAAASTTLARVAPAQVGVAPPSPPQIVTTGSGEARVSPDRATISIGVQSKATTASAAASDNARRQKAILDTLKSIGLAPEQLSTSNYNVSPDMQYNQTNGTSKVVGYTVTNLVTAQVKNISDVGRVIDAALAKGANEISGLQFESSKADSVRRAALGIAVANARADAEALAKASGGSLGALLEVSTSSMPIRPVMYDRAMLTAKAAAPTPIEPGEQTVTASVSARWTFVPR